MWSATFSQLNRLHYMRLPIVLLRNRLTAWHSRWGECSDLRNYSYIQGLGAGLTEAERREHHRNMLALSSNVSQEDIVEENRFQHVKSASVEVPRPKVHEVQTSTRAFHQSICTFNFVCTAHATPLACFLNSLGSVSRRCGHTRALAGS